MGKSVRLKRLAIARDVLAQLKLKRYKSTPGTYLHINDVPDIDTIDPNVSIQELFKTQPDVSCEVCALGACFMSLINLDNKVNVGQFCTEEELDYNSRKYLDADFDLMHERLGKYFPGHMLALIESAFEMREMGTSDTDPRFARFYEAYDLIPEHLYQPAIVWGKRYKNSNERLKAIMQNIVRNGGDFIVPKKLVAKYGKRPEDLVTIKEQERSWS